MCRDLPIKLKCIVIFFLMSRHFQIKKQTLKVSNTVFYCLCTGVELRLFEAGRSLPPLLLANKQTASRQIPYQTFRRLLSFFHHDCKAIVKKMICDFFGHILVDTIN